MRGSRRDSKGDPWLTNLPCSPASPFLLRSVLPHSPANVEAATLYRDNNKDYVKRVRATVEQSWVDEDIPI